MIQVLSQKNALAVDEFTITSNYISEEEIMENSERNVTPAT